VLGGSLEENILTALTWNDSLAPHIALHIRTGDFSIQTYRRIATAALDYLQSYHRAPRNHITDLLEQDIQRGSDGRFMLDVLRQMEILAPSLNEEYVRNTLDKFIATQRLISAVNNASEQLHEGNLEEAREILRAPHLLLQSDTTPGAWLHDTNQWLAFLDEEDNSEFSSGIEVLDERGVCPGRGEIMILLGATGTGKSWFLVNVGKHNVIGRRKNVLHLTLENSRNTTLLRYTQNFLELTRSEVESEHIHTAIFEDRDDPEKVQRKRTGPFAYPSIRSLSYEELAHRLKPYQGRGQLLVKHFPTGTLTLGMLSAFLDSLEQTDKFRPDLVLLDYLTLMHLDMRDIRNSIGQLARNLRGLATTRNFALVTVAQANRQAVGRKWVTSNLVAEDWSMPGTSDTFLTYSQTAHERKINIARILVDKARNSGDKWSAYIQQEYQIGQFCTDSAYMGKRLEEQLSEDE
jgi:replicative DNA helicase